MAQTGFTPIALYYSTTAGVAPTAGNLVAGELAINTADGKLFYKDSSGVVQVLATKSGAAGVFTSVTDSGLTAGRVTFAGTAGLLSDSSNFVWDNTYARLGIGTTGPAGKIDVTFTDNTFLAGLQITNSNTGSQAQSKVVLTNNSGNSLALIQNGSAVSSGVAYVGTSSTQALTLGTGYAEQMRLTTNGQALFSTASINTSVKMASYAADTVYGLGVFGDTYGVRFTGTTNSYNIEGVDKTLVGSFQPITLGGGGYLALRTGTGGGGSLSERLRINDAGQVLIGTSTAVTATPLLQVAKANSFDYGQLFLNSTDSVAINKGGGLSFGGSYTGTTPTYWASIFGLKETATDGEYGGYLAFYTRPTGGSGTEKMRITSAGYVGLGVYPPPSKLSVNGGGASGACDQFRLGHDPYWYYQGRDDVYGPLRMTGTQYGVVAYEWRTVNSGGTGFNSMMLLDSGSNLTIAGGTATKASGLTWANPSDSRLKDNIQDFTKGLEDLTKINVKTWEYNGKGGTTVGSKGLGVIADEIMQFLPDTVDTYKAKLNQEDEIETEIKRFDASEITWLLVNSVKELSAKVTALEAQLAAKG